MSKQSKKRYIVSGICFVPNEVSMVIEASSEEEAVKTALAGKWSDHIMAYSQDECSAFGWEPRAKALE